MNNGVPMSISTRRLVSLQLHPVRRSAVYIAHGLYLLLSPPVKPTRLYVHGVIIVHHRVTQELQLGSGSRLSTITHLISIV